MRTIETKEEIPTVVVFRTFRDNGAVLALFPEVPWVGRYECASYMHVGQHSAATPYAGLIARTRPSTPAEIAPLTRELESIGYVLKQTLRITRAMHETRQKESVRFTRAMDEIQKEGAK